MAKLKGSVILSLILLLPFLTFTPSAANAQTGYNPEFLGNAAPAPRPGFSPKIFFDYFNRNEISGHDIEVAFEPQYWIRGFTGDKANDYIQFLTHIPFGYRAQDGATATEKGWGLGSINANIEHFWKIYESDSAVWHFDNGLSGAFPTAMGRQNIRIGGNSYVVSWFQENFIKIDKLMMSISPISVTYVFQDSKTNITPGLALNIMNSAYGYMITDSIALGVTTSYQLGNLLGSDDGTGARLNKTQRLYLGPATCISFKNESSLQISIMVDTFTKNITRGQGVAFAYWKMF
jgi:hypothetical protein